MAINTAARETKPVTTQEIEALRRRVLDVIARLPPGTQNPCYRHTGTLFEALTNAKEKR